MYAVAHKEVQSANFWETRLSPFLDRHCLVLCLCLMGFACARIISTYNALSLTVDEPTHFACGLEYVAKHAYSLETQHPPLSRAMEALGPYLAGARPVSVPGWVSEQGLAAIANSGHVNLMIFLMRLGNLPFFLLSCWVVYSWSSHAFERSVAVIATGLYTLLPTTLADAGLATTDMALGATVGAAFLATLLWAEKPTVLRSIQLGLFVALACLSKFTALGYIPVAVCCALVFRLAVGWPGWKRLWEMTKQRTPTLICAMLVAVLLVWAAYWFSFGTATRILGRAVNLPAPEFFDGIRTAVRHNRAGHEAYLFGEFRMQGWWYYFPVVFVLKTPIAFLLLCTVGTYVCLRERAWSSYLMPLAFVLGIMVPALKSHIDIGVRHIEPIYIGLAIVAALGLRQLLLWSHTGLAAGLSAGTLTIWMVVSVAIHHPDYLGYVNAFAGKAPENILVDSNYDWGQDLKLLAKRLHQLGVHEFSMGGLDHAEYYESWYGLPKVNPVDSCLPSPGWNVISPTEAKSQHDSELYLGPNISPWYDQITPTERVGSLLLYYIPPGSKLKCRESAPTSSGHASGAGMPLRSCRGGATGTARWTASSPSVCCPKRSGDT